MIIMNSMTSKNNNKNIQKNNVWLTNYLRLYQKKLNMFYFCWKQVYESTPHLESQKRFFRKLRDISGTVPRPIHPIKHPRQTARCQSQPQVGTNQDPWWCGGRIHVMSINGCRWKSFKRATKCCTLPTQAGEPFIHAYSNSHSHSHSH